jgi:hypothetical protein
MAGAAWQRLQELRRMSLALAPLDPRRCGVGTLHGIVAPDPSAEAPFAELHVEQVGYALSRTSPEIAFHDRRCVSSVAGGRLRVGDELVQVLAEGAACRIWLNRSVRELACACPSTSEFDAAFGRATSAEGFVRNFTVALRAGHDVYVAGELARVDGALVLRPSGGALLVAESDPRRFAHSRAWWLAVFIVAELSACAFATQLALSTPHFGRASTIGAVLCLGFFLLATPLARFFDEMASSPDSAPVRGAWRRRNAALQSCADGAPSAVP